MKIAISCAGPRLEDDLDPRFGRAACFLIVDNQTMEFSVVDNEARNASGGAGVAAAQSVVDQQVEAVIASQLGPKAMDVLAGSDVALYQGIPGSVHSNIIAFNQNKLARLSESGPSHAGMR